jgi:hypothetical protein
MSAGDGKSAAYVLARVRTLLSTQQVKEAERLVEEAFRAEQALEHQSDGLEATLSKTRKWILGVGFVAAAAISIACGMKSKSGRFGGTLFIMLSAVVLYLAAIVPQIQFFDKVKARATDGVMTSFLALAMVAVTLGLVSRGFALKTAYAANYDQSTGKIEGTDHLIALIGMSVILVPFLLHVYMIRQISLYNDASTATTAASKKLAHWAWYALLILYLCVWIFMAVWGIAAGKKAARAG